MIITSIILIALGLVSALIGLKVFRLILPLLGLVGGFMAGFTGVQAIFGTGVISTTIAIVSALFVGILFGILSYLFFEIGVVILAAIVGSSALSFLGVALGLQQDGFLVFMLGFTGAILGVIFATRRSISAPLVIVVTSLYGVALVMVGMMLVVGGVSLDQVSSQSISATIVSVVDQSFLWLLVWIGGSLFASRLQTRAALLDMMNSPFEFQPKF